MLPLRVLFTQQSSSFFSKNKWTRRNDHSSVFVFYSPSSEIENSYYDAHMTVPQSTLQTMVNRPSCHHVYWATLHPTTRHLPLRRSTHFLSELPDNSVGSPSLETMPAFTWVQVQLRCPPNDLFFLWFYVHFTVLTVVTRSIINQLLRIRFVCGTL